MIPYFQWTEIPIGPLSIQVWGLMVALGILAGTWASARFASRRGIERQTIYDGVFWLMVGAFLGARLFHVAIYEPHYYVQDPLETFRVWHGGLSVMGGFLGALVAFLIFAKKRKLVLLPMVDPFIYGLPLGLGCGRLGCFFIHDHPGTATDFFLGVRQPGGGAIHDHGLYLAINGFILAAAFAVLARKMRPDGFFARLFLIWYGIVRFVLDFWRVADAQYFGLTPAQYMSAGMVVAGVLWAIADRRKKMIVPA